MNMNKLSPTQNTSAQQANPSLSTTLLQWPYAGKIKQYAKNVMSDSSGLVDVSTDLENAVLYLQVKVLGNSNYRRAIINTILLVKLILCGLK